MLALDRLARGQLIARVLVDTLLPLAVAAVVVAVLTDALVNRIDAGELRTNTLLMGTRPIRAVSHFEEFVIALGSSAVLLVAAVGGAIAVAIPAGIAYAWSTNRAIRGPVWAVATFAASLPAFFWAIGLELAIAAVWSITGVRVLPIAGFGIDEHLVLPAVALGARPAAYVFRLTASAVEEIRHSDYVRTAVAKGLRERDLLARHVLPNAAPAIVAACVLGARGALSSLLIVEFVYIWGGAGLTFVQAIGARQAALAGGLAFTFAIASALLALAAQLVQARVRVRTA
jgi:peptide/nickel transport system permease protein